MQLPFGMDGNNAIKTLAIMKGINPADQLKLAAMILILVDKETRRLVNKFNGDTPTPTQPEKGAVGA